MELSCPQCGLVLAMTRPQIEYCPRCIARRRQPVPLIARALQRFGREGGAASPASGGVDDQMSGREATQLRAEREAAQSAPFATIGLNINTLAIGETLAKDGAVRAGVVAQAEKSTLKTNATPKEAAKAIEEVQQLGVPIGWDKPTGDPARASLFSTWGGTFRTLGGWLLTFLALSLGAPFWFGLLNKLTSLRTSGAAPSTKTESKG